MHLHQLREDLPIQEVVDHSLQEDNPLRHGDDHPLQEDNLLHLGDDRLLQGQILLDHEVVVAFLRVEEMYVDYRNVKGPLRQ